MNQFYNLDVVPINSLFGMSFFVPSYQRGYRWTAQQVKDLLEDIDEYINHNLVNDETGDSFYCLQPLVVKEMITDTLKDDCLDQLNKIQSNANFFVEANDILNKYVKWEVIDGQQRLTTLCLILKYLSNKIEDDYPYRLEYETRSASCIGVSSEVLPTQVFINSLVLDSEDANVHKYDTIDYYHFFEAYCAIKEWFKDKEKDEKKGFNQVIQERVRLIWYRTEEKDPIKVFTRLNIGKISLTNAELIKALFLNRSNFVDNDSDSLQIKQNEIASQWDNIERSLQKDELWLFIHAKGYERPTRIDFIFDLICEQDKLHIGNENCGTDDYRTFRYFNKYFKQSRCRANKDGYGAIKLCWKEVLKIYNTIIEWYDDVILYHYVGFLIECGRNIKDLLLRWESATDKEQFILGIITMPDGQKKNGLVRMIKKIIAGCYDTSIGFEKTVYEEGGTGGKKTKCRPILLLHNIQTIIKQNEELKRNEAFPDGVFYKFPFHLFKNEDWDIEHIDSNNENPLNNVHDQKEWCAYSLISGVELGDELRKRIKSFLKTKPKDIPDDEFDKIYKEVLESTKSSKVKKLLEALSAENLSHNIHSLLDEAQKEVSAKTEDSGWDDRDSEKNMIWNYTLLDCHTNRGYGNAIFPAKRRTIIGKERGIQYSVDYENGCIHPTVEEELRLSELSAKQNRSEKENEELKKLYEYKTVAFIPPCTRNVFMKFYSATPNHLISWDKKDAKAYINNISVLLKDFLE